MESCNSVFDAAKKGDVELLKALLKDGAPYTAVNSMGYTVMHIAAQLGSIPCVNAILDAARNDGLSCEEVSSKLCCPARDGATPYLLAQNVWNSEASCILSDFEFIRDFPVLWLQQTTCDYCPRVVLARRPSEEEMSITTPPLNAAIEQENFNLLETLLESGADVNICDAHFHNSALHCALMCHDEKFARRILEEERDMTLKNRNGYTALSVAVLYHNTDVVKLILDKIKGVYRSPNAILLNCFPDKDDGHPLLCAAYNRKWEVFDMLSELYAGSTVPVVGGSPLHVACTKKNIKKIRSILHSYPGMINATDESHYNPMHVCAVEGDLEMLHILIEAGGSLDSTNLRTGCTLLHCAALNYSTEILKYLLERSLDVNAIGLLGETPLHKAVGVGNLPAVKILLKHGADASLVNNNGMCPLAVALYQGYYNVSVLLCEVTPKRHGTSVILQAFCKRDNSLRLVLNKGFTVQDYSGFWINAMINFRHDVSNEIELLMKHGMNLCGLEDICNVCFNCQPSILNYSVLHNLAKYGAVEKIMSSASSFKPKNFLKKYFSKCCPCVYCRNTKLMLCMPFGCKNEFTLSHSPPNLSQSCRWIIRQTLALRHHAIRREDIRQLPIPTRLKKFLVFETNGETIMTEISDLCSLNCTV